MPTDDRRWTDADRELVAEVLWRFPSKTTTRAAATSVLDALTAAGWRPPPDPSRPQIQIHIDPGTSSTPAWCPRCSGRLR